MEYTTATYKKVVYDDAEDSIRCVTLENPLRAPVQLLSVFDLIRFVLHIKNPSLKWARAFRQKQLQENFPHSMHRFPNGNMHPEPVVDGTNAVALLNTLTSRKGNAIKEKYNKWVSQVLSGSTDIQADIAANAELAEDPRTLNSTIRHSLTAERVPVTYLINADDMPVVYLRCDPRTYEVFTEEQYTSCPCVRSWATI
jgi:hypothetical protein